MYEVVWRDCLRRKNFSALCLTCYCSILTANGVGATTFTWSPTTGLSDSIGAIVTACPSTTTTYTVTGTSICGTTSATSTVVYFTPTPASYVQDPDTVCANWYSVLLNPGNPSGGYYTSNGLVSGNTFYPQLSGVGTWFVVYQYTDNNGCVSTDTSYMTVLPCTGISSINSESNFSVYPNPANATIILSINLKSKNAAIEIFDITGRKMKSVSEKVIDVSSFASGIYFLKITDGEKTYTAKFIKQ